MEYPLITKKVVRQNRKLRRIQNDTRKRNKHIKGRFPKARISKVIELTGKKPFYNLSGLAEIKKMWNGSSLEDILAEIGKYELVGQSGSGFPTQRKINAVLNAKTEEKYLLINGVECDPGLLQDEWLLENRFAEIEAGITFLSNYINFKRIILAVKESKLQKLVSSAFDIHIVPDRYPMGEERILINEVLGRSLNRDEIPAEYGILVLNLQTVHAISEILKGEYQAGTKYITVADYTIGEAVVAKVKVDTAVSEILMKTLGYREGKESYTGGGIMMGHKAGVNEVITATTNFVAYGMSTQYLEDGKCRKCGACARKCPMNIRVDKIVQALEKNKNADVSIYHPETCIRCGTCTYHCRAGKNTMEAVLHNEGE